QCLDAFTGNDVGANGRLNGNIKHLPRNKPAHLAHHLSPAVPRIAAMHHHGQGVDAISIDENIDLDDVRWLLFLELVIHGGIASRHGFEAIKEVQHDLGKWHLITQMDLPAVVAHVLLHAPLVQAKRHHRPDVFLGHEESERNYGFTDFG